MIPDARHGPGSWPSWLGEGNEPPREIARIWATVDTERTLETLVLPAERLPDDPHLGARVSLVRESGEPPLAIVEPSREGQLAAWLARHGEAIAGSYVAAASLAGARRRAAVAGVPVSPTDDGPFGPSFLVLGGAAGGSFLLIVEAPAGTIDR